MIKSAQLRIERDNVTAPRIHFDLLSADRSRFDALTAVEGPRCRKFGIFQAGNALIG